MDEHINNCAILFLSQDLYADKALSQEKCLMDEHDKNYSASCQWKQGKRCFDE